MASYQKAPSISRIESITEKTDASATLTALLYYNGIKNKFYVATTTTQEQDAQEAPIHEVPASQLPTGVLGFYNTNTHQIYVTTNVATTEAHYIIEHEKGHSYGATDEETADKYAISKTGRVLRPFGQTRNVWIQNSDLVK